MFVYSAQVGTNLHTCNETIFFHEVKQWKEYKTVPNSLNIGFYYGLVQFIYKFIYWKVNL